MYIYMHLNCIWVFFAVLIFKGIFLVNSFVRNCSLSIHDMETELSSKSFAALSTLVFCISCSLSFFLFKIIFYFFFF